ncbi:MAG: ABC transporter substrate-binding protein [Clostridiaceae bacterium]|nr:ABC transporter substrate-binding protein [Clostridiaceae bacterium]
MKARNIVLFFITVLLAVQITGCSGSKENMSQDGALKKEVQVSYPITVEDSFGRKIVLDHEPQRVVSIAPNITEAIYALNKEDRLVGRTDYCDYPPEVAQIESVGDIRQPNIERVLELKPDLVFASTHFQKETLSKLEEVNIKVAVLYGEESFDGVYDVIQKTGIFLNAQNEAEDLVKNMKDKVEMVKDKVRELEKPDVYYVVSYGKYGDYTAGRGTFIASLIETAGGKNAADDVEGWNYSLERLLEKDPDIMICSKYFESKAGIEGTNGYDSLKAVKGGKLFEIDNNMLDRQGPRLADGLYEMARIIHPEAF